MDPDKMSFISVVGKKYAKKDDVSLDNMRFSECSFDECNLLYSGGPFVMDNCWLRNCELSIQGTAAIVVESLRQMGFQISPPAGQIAGGSSSVQ
jgi:hypothetical protein